VLRCFIEALGPNGTLLDSNGNAKAPIRVQLSETRAESAGVGESLAALDEGGKPAHPPPPPPPPKPWYRRWEIVGPIAGALVQSGASHPKIKVNAQLSLGTTVVGIGTTLVEFESGKTVDVSIPMTNAP